MGIMYHLHNAFVSFITPPGVFVLLFFIIALFAKRFRKLFLFLGVLFYLSTTYWIGNLLVRPAEKPYNTPLKETKVDGVVVLGAGFYPGSSNLPVAEGGFKRLVYALMLAKKYNLPLIFAGANGELEATKATVQALNESLDLNLTETNKKLNSYFSIVYTENSTNTIQNAMRSIDFFDAVNIKQPKIYLVTSATHMKRAKGVFEDFGFNVIPAATDFRTRSDSCYCFYFPSVEGLRLNYFAVHEAIGNIRDFFKRFFLSAQKQKTDNI